MKFSRIALAGGVNPTADLEVGYIKVEFNYIAPNRVKLNDYIGYQFEKGDDALLLFRMPQDFYWPGATVNVKVGWCINEAYATNSAEVQWGIRWMEESTMGDVVIGAGGGAVIYSGDINVPTTAYQVIESQIGTINCSAFNTDILDVTYRAGDTTGRPVADVVRLSLSRYDLDGGTDPDVDPVALYVKFEYPKDFPRYF